MSNQPKKNPQNVPGKFYVSEDCVACEACQDAAPNNFRYGENGLSFVFKQPVNSEEADQCQEAVDCCPMEAVRSDGELATQGYDAI